jgi:mannosyl-3-phosphoglycerate phosphatase
MFDSQSRLAIFSDLDGTLLDHDTYGYEPVRPALACIKKRRIPLILCSSKTRAEMTGIRRRLKLADPFITENGGAVYIPRETLPLRDVPFKEQGKFQVIELGRPYGQLMAGLHEIREETGIALRGFADMSVAEVAERTGLDNKSAAQARQREYSEPFLILEPGGVSARLNRAVRRRKLRIVRGGRFYHLLGDNDKGQAVRLLTALYRRGNPEWQTIGLGDSANDFPLLENVDFPVLVRKRGGARAPWSGPRKAYYTRGIGPVGWNEAVLTLLMEKDPDE